MRAHPPAAAEPREEPNLSGILLLDKPAGVTSHDVVAACRRRLGVRRIGHAGTLDPPATGLLVLGVGRATRLLRFLEAGDKEYQAEIVLGVATATEDAAGEVTAEADASAVTAGMLRATLARFTGRLEQVPPMVSAIKVGGERLYRKARRGEEVERPPRLVTIHTLRLEGFTPGPRARARIRLRCSKGTYVRSLARDIGTALGVGGHVAALRRLASGAFRVEDAVRLDDAAAAHMRPMEEAVAGFPRRTVGEEEARAVTHGRPLPAAGIPGQYAVFGPSGLVAMAEDDGEVARSLCVLAGAGS